MNNQNESPFGNPRFLLALGVTFLGLWFWQYYMNKNFPQNSIKNETPIVNSTSTKSVGVSSAGVVNGVGPSTAVSGTTLASTNNIKEENFLNYEDENVSFKISSQGMGIRNYVLKNYKSRNNENITFEIGFGQMAQLYKNEIIHFEIKKINDLTFQGSAIINGKVVTKTLTFNKNLYSFNSALNFESGLESFETSFFQQHTIPKNENFLMPSFEQQDFIFIENGSTKDNNISSLKENETFNSQSTSSSLSAVGTQYFALAVVNKSSITPALNNKLFQNIASVEVKYDIKGSTINEINQIYYLGPKKSEILNQVDPQLIEVLNYGIFGFISKLLLKLMMILHGFLGNWGYTIIALTLIVRVILLPFNVMSFRSAQAMQKIKPKMDAVREKFKDDPMRMNKETMALMKENNANPLSGCLPMLLQIPIFFAMWKTIGSSIEIYQQPFFGWITDLSYHDSYFLLPLLMGVTMYFQQKLTPTTMDATQAKILSFMPIIFTLFMLTLPSGLTLYNFVSALFGVIQQYLLLRDINKSQTPQLV